MKYIYSFALVAITLTLVGAGCAQTDSDEMVQEVPAQEDQQEVTNTETMTYAFPGVLEADQIENKIVRIQTEKGEIVFELYPDTAPITVSNFVYLANQGYYESLTFHRRVEGFVIQGGDPSGDGSGGPGYTIEEEVDDDYAYDRGIVAMAKTIMPHSTGSQFFIMLADYPLPKEYTIFGRVLEGMDVVDQIVEGDVMTKVTVESADGEDPDTFEK